MINIQVDQISLHDDVLYLYVKFKVNSVIFNNILLK